jgi:hypothetical protein
MKPHLYAILVNDLRDIAARYAGQGQLRERLGAVLHVHGIEPEHDAAPCPCCGEAGKEVNR